MPKKKAGKLKGRKERPNVRKISDKKLRSFVSAAISDAKKHTPAIPGWDYVDPPKEKD